jgi:hypothetical protein
MRSGGRTGAGVAKFAGSATRDGVRSRIEMRSYSGESAPRAGTQARAWRRAARSALSGRAVLKAIASCDGGRAADAIVRAAEGQAALQNSEVCGIDLTRFRAVRPKHVDVFTIIALRDGTWLSRLRATRERPSSSRQSSSRSARWQRTHSFGWVRLSGGIRRFRKVPASVPGISITMSTTAVAAQATPILSADGRRWRKR